MEVWILTFYLRQAPSFEGGQYQTETQCYAAMRMQRPHWREVYGRRLIGWSCSEVTMPITGFGTG